jgi:hypothetical protein
MHYSSSIIDSGNTLGQEIFGFLEKRCGRMREERAITVNYYVGFQWKSNRYYSWNNPEKR